MSRPSAEDTRFIDDLWTRGLLSSLWEELGPTVHNAFGVNRRVGGGPHDPRWIAFWKDVVNLLDQEVRDE